MCQKFIPSSVNAFESGLIPPVLSRPKNNVFDGTEVPPPMTMCAVPFVVSIASVGVAAGGVERLPRDCGITLLGSQLPACCID